MSKKVLLRTENVSVVRGMKKGKRWASLYYGLRINLQIRITKL